MWDITFGERLRRMRTKEYITQGELGAKLGISRAAVSFYELDKREPDIETLCSIRKYFDVSADYLLGLKEDQAEGKEKHMTLRDLVLKVSDHTTVEVHIRMLGMDFSTSHFAEVYLEDDKKREDSRALMDRTIKKIWVRDDLLVVHLEE